MACFSAIEAALQVRWPLLGALLLLARATHLRNVALLLTLRAGLILLGTLCAGVVCAAAAGAFLGFLAVLRCMPKLATVEAGLLLARRLFRRPFLGALLLLARATHLRNVALLLALRASLVLLGALRACVVCAAAAAANLGLLAI